jgi:endonuclease/exonuclease/phosphatase family metal-dependent hydrolase
MRTGSILAIIFLPALIAAGGCSDGNDSNNVSVPGAPVTLANLNVLHGFNCDSPEVDTKQCRVSERIALLREHLIAAGCPDLVTLQEVINAEFAPTANGQPVASILLLIKAELPNLAAVCGFPYQLVYEPHLTPPLTISETDEEVILSRYPVLQTGTRILYGPLVNAGIFARHVLYARVAHPSGPVDVYTTHLASEGDFSAKICGTSALCPVECDSNDTVRVCQAEQLALYVEATRGDTDLALISGDFNAAPDSTEYVAMTSRGWLDSHLLAGQPECDPITGIACSSGRDDSSLQDIENPALHVDRRIDYIFAALPEDNTVCTLARQSGQQQATLGSYEIESAGLFAGAPNPFTQTCGSSPDAPCWVSDHSGNQVRLSCQP